MMSFITVNVREMIKMFTDVEIRSDDGLPQKVCFECHEQLEQFSKFREQCKNSNAFLHRLINDNDDNCKNIVVKLLQNTEKEQEEQCSNTIPLEEKIAICPIDELSQPHTTSNSYECQEVEEKVQIENFTNDFEGENYKNIVAKLLQKTEEVEEECSNTSLSDEKFTISQIDESSQNQSTFNSHECQEVEAELPIENCTNDSNTEKLAISQVDESSQNESTSNSYECQEVEETQPIANGTNDSNAENDNFVNIFKTSDINLLSLCELCGKEMPKYKLPKHMHWHSLEQKHKCDHCQQAFKMPNGLAKHMKNVHKLEKNFQCHVCNENFYLKYQLNVHLRSHSIYQCTLCDYTTKDLNDWKEHEKIHETNNSDNQGRTITCTLCDKQIPEIRFTQHINRHNLKKKHKCPRCPRAFKMPCELAKHLKSVKHLHSKQEQFNCHICNRKFLVQAQLDYHMKSHTSNRCKICAREFYDAGTLRRHETIHQKRERVDCFHCNKTFCTRDTLKKHIQLMHYPARGAVKRAEKKTCPICGKDVSNIEMHQIRKHTDEKPFKCNQCDCAYALPDSLQYHIKKIHSGNERTLCSMCGKVFLTIGDLNIHLRSHDENRKYDCHLCNNKSYKTKCGLRCHLQAVHDNVRPYECSICTKRFLYRRTLRLHMLTHTGVRPFACHICGRTFTRKTPMQMHLKIVHKVIKFNSSKID